MKKLIGCLALTLLIPACGWQLRGTTDIPQNVSHLYLSSASPREASSTELMAELRQLLKANHASLVDDSKAAHYELNLLSEIKDKRTVGVGSDALSSAYEITLKANYEIRINSREFTTKATATSVRSFNYNTASISSAAQEEMLLMKEMRLDLAQQMLRRLNAAITHPSTSKNTHNESNHGKTTP